MSKRLGLCPKCLEIGELTRHHIFPRRWFKRKEIIYLCRTCHNDIENIIYKREKDKQLKEHVYVKIIKSFLVKKTRRVIFVRRNGQKKNGSDLQLASIKIKTTSPVI